MANNEININIKATDTASPVIEKVQTAVTNLGKNATMSFDVAGFEEVNKQINALQGKVNSLVKTQAPKVKIIDDASLLNGLTNAEKSLDSFSSKVNSSLGTTSQVMKNFNAEVSKMNTVKGFNYETGKVNTASFENLSGTITNLKSNATSNLSAIASNATNSFDKVSKKSKEVSSNIDNIGSRLRYLSLVTGVIFAGLTAITGGFVKSVRELEDSQMKLMVASMTSGVVFENANEMAKKLSSDGMISQKTAYTALTNAIVMTTSMSQKGVDTVGKNINEIALAQAGALVQMWKDSAVVMKQNISDSIDSAVEKASVGARTLREVAADSTGIEIVFRDAWKEYAKTYGLVADNLTKAQKQQAVYNAYMKEGQRYAGAASLASMTFSGSLTKMNANVLMMKQSLGNALLPLIGTFAVWIDTASRNVRNFAEAHSGLTFAIIAGTVAMTGLITVITSFGALANMFYSSIGGIINIFKGISLAGIQTTAIIVGLTIAIGGLVYAWLKMTGKWDKWKNSMTELGMKIKNTMKQVSGAGDSASETTNKLAKALRDLQSSINDTSSDFNQQMSEWVANHDKTISKLKSQIGDLSDEYKKTTDKIKKDFEETNKELTLSHARKTEDLQEQIDEEVSKGIWADQTKIKNLKKELSRENEDYAIASQDKLDKKNEELTEEEKQNEKKLKDLQEELKKEQDLEKKHSIIISFYRTQPYLDEVEKMEEAYKNRLSNLSKELSDIKETYSIGKEVASGYEYELGKIGETTLKNTNKTDTTTESLFNFGLEALKIGAFMGAGGIVFNALKNFFASSVTGFSTAKIGAEKLLLLLSKISLPISVAVGIFFVASELQEVFNQIAKLKGELDDLNKSQDIEVDLNNALTIRTKERVETGEITQKEANAIFEKQLKGSQYQAEKNTELTEYLDWFSLDKVVNTISSKFDFIDKFFEDFGKKEKDFIVNLFTDIGNFFTRGFEELSNKTKFGLSLITGFFKIILDSLGIDIVKWWETTKNNFFEGLDILYKYFNDAKTFLTKIWTDTWNSIKNILGPQIEAITKPISEAFSVIKKLYEIFKNEFEKTWSNLWNGLASSLSNAFRGVKQSFADIINPIIAKFNGLIEKINTVSTYGSDYLGWEENPYKITTVPELRFKEGGKIPGSVNDEVPIIAHGQETVLPAGVSPVVININNPSVRSDADIKSIAQAVKDVISRELSLKKFA
jgi:tetrahydromethanopterin S-methyltransferase subunit B/uncharacterized protein YukE